MLSNTPAQTFSKYNACSQQRKPLSVQVKRWPLRSNQLLAARHAVKLAKVVPTSTRKDATWTRLTKKTRPELHSINGLETFRRVLQVPSGTRSPETLSSHISCYCA